MAELKLFYSYINGDKCYTHAVNANQAATALGNKHNVFVAASNVKEVKPFYVYTFARKTSYYDRTSYVEILAVSIKQAWFYFNQCFGYQEFKELQNSRLADSDDLNKLKPGQAYDVTW